MKLAILFATKFESIGSEFILYALSAPIAKPFLNKGSFDERPTLSRLISISEFFSFNSTALARA